MRAVIDAYHAACARITRTYDGFLAEFRGDGILAYFGYPRAHEDDAERTVRAGLDIIAAVARLETLAAEPLAVRIGIATGVVVVGDLSRQGALREHAVVGETPNLAARLQSLAEPGWVVIADATRRLVGKLFECLDLGHVEAKGFAQPVPAYRVLGAGETSNRFEALRRSVPWRARTADEHGTRLNPASRLVSFDGKAISELTRAIASPRDAINQLLLGKRHFDPSLAGFVRHPTP